jgi:hypothetical protein
MSRDNPDCQEGFLRSFLPLFLIALSIAYFFACQLEVIFEERAGLLSALIQQENSLKDGRATVARLKQSSSSLIQLADSGNTDAKAIVEKYNLRGLNPPSAHK